MLSPELFDLRRFPRAAELAASTLVVTPTYQEKDTVVRHARSVLAAVPGLSLLVVDDASPDGTADLVDGLRPELPRLHLLRRQPPRSFAGASVDGIRWALERGFTRVVSMDADGSHGSIFLPLLLDLSADADFVVGSRYLRGISVLNWPLRRVLLSTFANVYCRLITGVPCSDLTAGFCCYRADLLRRIDLPSIRAAGYAFEVEIKHRAWRAGGRLGETSIVFVERLAGTSKMSSKLIWEGVRHPWWCRLVLGRPLAPPPPPIQRSWDEGL